MKHVYIYIYLHMIKISERIRSGMLLLMHLNTIGPRHPMKPQRLAALNNLVVNYELDKKMEMRLTPRANAMDLRYFSAAFIRKNMLNFLRRSHRNVQNNMNISFLNSILERIGKSYFHTMSILFFLWYITVYCLIKFYYFCSLEINYCFIEKRF
uniref:Hist_deacetyl domain-containing protein n=1 Tax=Heterorhabditis bacteriophora TaxID=37862 RepID=A0A1I7WXI2_HETBA